MPGRMHAGNLNGIEGLVQRRISRKRIDERRETSADVDTLGHGRVAEGHRNKGQRILFFWLSGASCRVVLGLSEQYE